MTEQPPKKKQKSTGKPMFRTASPYERSPIDQTVYDQILDLLISVLRPLGEHHASKAKSKGKKRRRKATKRVQADGSIETSAASANDVTSTAPKHTSIEDAEQHILPVNASEPAPSNRAVVVGYNAITRHLEALSRLSRPAQFQTPAPEASVPQKDQNAKPPAHVAAVFLLRPLDNLIYSHLPLLCQTASLANPQIPGTRLVLLDVKAENRVADVLRASPRTSVIAVLDQSFDSMEDTNGVKELIDHVREHVQAVEVPWLKQAVDAQWLGVNIDTQQN